MKKTAISILLFLVCVIASSCAAVTDSGYKVRISLEATDGIEITTSNPAEVSPGENASFGYKLADGMKLVTADREAIITDETLTIENVLYPATVHLEVRPLKTLLYEITNDYSLGTVTSSVAGGSVTEDTPITVKAEAKEGNFFIGWSLGKTLKNGGTSVSYASEYTFPITENTELYANYAAAGSDILVYNANGGIVTGSGADVLYVEVVNKLYLCPNTLADTGALSREGYVLYGYNTMPDGSGIAYGLGWNVIMPESGMVTLYAQWAKYTDVSKFTYKNSGTKITITGYSGDDKVLVIPEYIDATPVTTILSNAFKDCDFETIIFSKKLVSVAANAFVNCKNLTTLYINDSMRSITDSAFQNCPNFSTLMVNAIIAPRYVSGRTGTYCIKYERLITAPGKKMIIVSGSSSAYGINSEVLAEQFDGEYSIVNYGTNINTCALFYLEVISHFTGKGDIVIQAPELGKQQLGNNNFEVILWQVFEGAFDAFSHVDIRNYTNVLSSFADFNSTRVSMRALTYENYENTVNIYGDFYTFKAENPITFASSKNSLNTNADIITQTMADRLNKVHEAIESTGAKVYFSFSPLNINALNAASQSVAYRAKYEEKIRSLIKCPVISNLEDYIMAGNYFYNSDYHLGSSGAIIRTKKLAEDIKAQLQKES